MVNSLFILVIAMMCIEMSDSSNQNLHYAAKSSTILVQTLLTNGRSTLRT